MKNVSRSWKNALKKRAAFVLAVSIVCLLTSCKPQKQAIVRQQAIPVPSVKIDTCFVFHKDTAFVIETDTFRIETLIRDTLISQHIETKPYYITTTDTIYIEQDEQKTEVKQAKQERNMAAALFIFVCLLLFFLAKTLKK
ncbi:MAG: hypothetical protein PUC08_01425 [Bacteroidales bacterium]|nr:hypothetical protein [Bacteroidales bacterium]